MTEIKKPRFNSTEALNQNREGVFLLNFAGQKDVCEYCVEITKQYRPID
jgi:hypothetical protein